MTHEEPRYTSQLKDGPFEVRDYPQLLAAEVSLAGPRSQASAVGYDLLAAYIFGDNTAGLAAQDEALPEPSLAPRSETIAVTVPVILLGESGDWTVRIVLPSVYAFETLPTPNNARVHLAVVPPTRLAVLQFSGLARDEQVAIKTRELQTLLATRALQAKGPTALARYDAPWTPWYLRRNELMVPIRH
jgi:hypothetical protein